MRCFKTLNTRAGLTRRQWAVNAFHLFFVPFLVPFSSRIAEAAGRIVNHRKEEAVKLPEPIRNGDMPLEQALQERRTVRSYQNKPMTLRQLSQMLWAAQGETSSDGKRAAPSAGALYPLDVYAVVGANGIADLKAGVYHYQPTAHSLSIVTRGDVRKAVSQVSLYQSWMARAPVNLVITAEYARICGKYGERGVRYAMIEAGHVGQNIFLQAEALGIRAGIVGAFDDDGLIRKLNTPDTHRPLLVMPIGHKS